MFLSGQRRTERSIPQRCKQDIYRKNCESLIQHAKISNIWKISFHWAETKRILPSFFFNSEVHWTENWLQGSSAASFNTHSSPHCIEKNYLSLFWDHLYKLSCLLGDHIAKNDIGDYSNNECLHAAPQVVFTSQRERLSLHKEDFGTYCSFALIITVEVATETQISSL